MILKQSVTYARKFLMVLASDHVTGATGLSSSIVVKLSKGVSAAGTTAAGAVTELDSTNLPGMYQCLLSVVDTAVLGDLGFDISVATCDHTTFIDQVQTQLFSDLQINASGRALIANNLTVNTALNPFLFPMTSVVGGARQTGLTVTAQRSLGAAGFAPCANAVSEIGTTGIYAINLAAGDLNSTSTIGLLFTAPGANDLFVPVTPTP